jgi:aryl-alcohol dehydrogenase-like predicted oxidoreductase
VDHLRRKHSGFGITAFSPLASGVLTGKYDGGIPEDSRMARNERMQERLTDDVRQRVIQLKPIADEPGITRAQLALAWVLRHPSISSVITGATKAAHVENNVQAAEAKLDPEVIDRINEIFPL